MICMIGTHKFSAAGAQICLRLQQSSLLVPPPRPEVNIAQARVFIR